MFHCKLHLVDDQQCWVEHGNGELKHHSVVKIPAAAAMEVRVGIDCVVGGCDESMDDSMPVLEDVE